MAPYSETILDHFRNPRNYGDLPDADIVREAYNQLCGDRVRIALRLAGDVVAVARFKGDACAIGQAAASVLTEMLVGLTLEEALELDGSALVERLNAEIATHRMQCALLPLQALREGIAARRGSR